MTPFLDLRTINLAHREALHEALDRVLQSGWFILGREVEAFEQEYAAYCESPHCVGVANGLDALILALRAMDVGPGDEVIVPSNTYIATWLAVTHVGATPVPVEPDLDTYNMDPRLVEAAITPRTKVLLPVHLCGQPADLGPLLEIADRRGLLVLEDAAQAHGAVYRGRRIGAHGDAVAWSFYPGKNLGALGDGGAITTRHAKLAERLRVLRNYGSRVKYHNEEVGYNSRLDELQAAFLRAKLPLLEDENRRRDAVARIYLRELSGIDGLVLPRVPLNATHVWHLFVVRHARRDELAQRLAQDGIGTVIHYPVPPHQQPAYRDTLPATMSLPVSEEIHAQVLSLPMSPVQTEAQSADVVSAVKRAVAALASS